VEKIAVMNIAVMNDANPVDACPQRDSASLSPIDDTFDWNIIPGSPGHPFCPK
jgi:hypothetical protein